MQGSFRLIDKRDRTYLTAEEWQFHCGHCASEDTDRNDVRARDRPYWRLGQRGPGASWPANLTRKQLRRRVHRLSLQLEVDIGAFIDIHNEHLKPFRWTKSVYDILTAVKRFCLRVEQYSC